MNFSVLAIAASAAVVLSAALAGQHHDDDEYPKLSPFEAVRFQEAMPEVQVGGRWYELLAINGEPAGDIVAFSKETFGSLWRKRFEEDLVELLARKGKPPDRFVRLDLKDLETRETVRLEQVEMTEENRQAIWRAARDRDDRDTTRASPSPAPLSREAAQADLDRLEWAIDSLFAYRNRSGEDWRASLRAAREALPETVSVDSFLLLLMRLLAPLGDGHARVDGFEEALRGGYLPFLVEESRGRLVTVRPDRSGFVDPSRPFLAKIDGLDVERWLEAASSVVARGSAALVQRRSIRNLRFLAWLRQEMQRPPSEFVEVELTDGREGRVGVKLRLASRRPLYGDRFERGHRLLERSVGYVRIAKMSREPGAIEEILQAVNRFRDARGLVIDVRGNGGGSRDLLLRLFPHLPAAGAAPIVANVARYRLRPGDPRAAREGYLSDRHLFPRSASRLSKEERAAIEAFARAFRPEWEPAGGGFSDWHYLVLGGSVAAAGPPVQQRVVILQDGDCFSATDVFLAALQGLRGITLMGTPSSGGSGRALPFRLERSGLTVRLSSMVSYRRDGRLLDGNGVAPDVHVEPEPEDFIGRTDSVLRAALDRLGR